MNDYRCGKSNKRFLTCSLAKTCGEENAGRVEDKDISPVREGGGNRWLINNGCLNSLAWTKPSSKNIYWFFNYSFPFLSNSFWSLIKGLLNFPEMGSARSKSLGSFLALLSLVFFLRRNTVLPFFSKRWIRWDATYLRSSHVFRKQASSQEWAPQSPPLHPPGLQSGDV